MQGEKPFCLDESVASAALQTAMGDVFGLTGRERHRRLERVAAHHPHLIDAEIERLMKKVRLLQEYGTRVSAALTTKGVDDGR